jgi:site-specific recombinase XerC
MAHNQTNQVLSEIAAPDLAAWRDAFITAKRAEGRTAATLSGVYLRILQAFIAFCTRRGVKTVDAIDPGIIREHLLAVAEHHAPSTVHRHYRTLKTWLRWYEAEAAPDGWRNPIKRVGAPRVPEQPLEPAPLDVLAELVSFTGEGKKGTRDDAVDCLSYSCDMLTFVRPGWSGGSAKAPFRHTTKNYF